MARDRDVGHNLVAFAFLSKHFHLAILGHENGHSRLAKELFGLVRLVVAVNAGGDRNEIRQIPRITIQATYKG